MYNWQYKEWANFQYDVLAISKSVPEFLKNFNKTDTVLQGLSVAEQQEEIIHFIISEAEKTSEIEGEYISRQDLMSSIKNNLGLNITPENVKDKKAVAIANVIIAVRNSHNNTLTEDEIKQWHKLLFEHNKKINGGAWREGEEPMQVISGAMGKETVHYEAPPSYRVQAEITQFVKWYNAFKINNPTEALIKTAIAHLYFESIHPFEDGNGRIGRAIAEKCLAQSLGKSVVLSLSSIIEKNKKLYYDALQEAQSTLQITNWIVYFTDVVTQAQAEAIEMIQHTIKKTKFFDMFGAELNARQLKVIAKMFDAGTKGFEGGMTAKKYIAVTKTTKPTATRDLQELVILGALSQHGKGRSVHYQLKLVGIL